MKFTTLFLPLIMVFGLFSTSLSAQTLPVTSKSVVALAHYTLGVDAAYHSEIAASKDHFAAAVVADPDFVSAAAWRLLLENANESPAMAPYMAVVKRGASKLPKGEQEMVRLALVPYNGPDAAQADPYGKLAAEYPQDIYLSVAEGRFYADAGESDKAITALQRVLKIDPTHPAALNLSGYAYMGKGDMTNAEKSFKAYIAAYPNHPNPYDSYGDFLQEKQDFKGASAQYAKAVAIDSSFKASADNLVRMEIAQRLEETFNAGFAERDAAKIASAYWERAQIFPYTGESVNGRAGYEARVKKSIAELKPGDKLRMKTDELIVIDPTTVMEIGHSDELIDGKAEIGKYMTLWAKMDGQWMIVRDMWTDSVAKDTETASN